MITSKGSPAAEFQVPSQLLSFRRTETIFYVGDVADALFRVKEGLIRITRMTPEGHYLTVRHLLEGDFFGEDVFTQAHRVETAEALTAVKVEAIDPQFLNEADLMLVTKSLSRQLHRVMDYEYHLQTGVLRQRLARYLLALARTSLAEADELGHIAVAATHELLAEGTASTRESVSKVVTILREEGLIASGYRNVTLLDMNRLKDVADTPS